MRLIAITVATMFLIYTTMFSVIIAIHPKDKVAFALLGIASLALFIRSLRYI